jgi:hypothetical protein
LAAWFPTANIPFGIKTRDPDIPSCRHSGTMRRSCCWSSHNQAGPLPGMAGFSRFGSKMAQKSRKSGDYFSESVTSEMLKNSHLFARVILPRACARRQLWHFATCGVESPSYYDGGGVHGRRGRAPKTPTLLDVLWVRGRLKLQIKNALFRECCTRTYELQRHRHAYRWGWHHVKAKSCH